MARGYITINKAKKKKDKQNNKQKYSQLWEVKLDLFCSGFRAEMTVLKSLKQLVWPLPDEP